MLEPQQGATYDQQLAIAQAAEAEGFDGFFRSDHLMRFDQEDPGPGPTESWITLAGIARWCSPRTPPVSPSPTTSWPQRNFPCLPRAVAPAPARALAPALRAAEVWRPWPGCRPAPCPTRPMAA